MRILPVLLALSMILAACGSSQPVEEEQPTESTNQALEDGADDATEPADSGDAATEEPAEEPASMAETAPEDILLNDGTRKEGDITKCPVSGHVFTVAADSPSVEHDGGTYYVCCKGCVSKFEADPAKFAAAGKAGESVEDSHKDHKKGDGHHHHHGEHK